MSAVENTRQVQTEVRAPIEVVLSRIASFVFGAIEVFLAFRFLLRLFGANGEAGFVKFIYAVSDVFMAPFNAIFSTQQVAGAIFEWSVLVAIAVYAVLSYGVLMLIRAVSPRDRVTTVKRTDSEDHE